MTNQQPNSPPQRPNLSPAELKNSRRLWLACLALLMLGVLAGSLGNRFVMNPTQARSSSQVDVAIRDFQSGHEQAALSTLKPIADSGNAKAQYWMADIYLDNGLGAKKDTAPALDYLHKSAAQGFVPAEGRLGEVYLNGDDAIQDFAQAQHWLQKAAVTGDVRAQRLMGRIYELGLGVEQNPAQAYGWYETAALSGNALAQRVRDTLVKRMSPAELSQGEQNTKTISADMKSAASTSPSPKKTGAKT